MTANIKEIPGFPGYGVTSDGRVFSCLSGRWRERKQTFDTEGYPKINLCVAKRQITRRVHKLVTLTFLGPRPPGLVANHIDGVKANSALSNLEWVTPSENVAHAHRLGLYPPRPPVPPKPQKEKGPRPPARCGEAVSNHKLTIESVLQIRSAAGTASLAELGRRYGVSKQLVHRILRGEKWPTRAVTPAPPGLGSFGQEPPRVTATPSCR